jgi:aarF domain-containing kinase
MGWGRQIRIFFLAVTVFLEYKLVQKREGWTKQQAAKDKLWNNTHERNAKRILKAITELKGLWVKAGQYLSTRADVLPSAYIRNLSQLQDSLPPRPLSEVCETIEKELGKSPSELFTDFDKTALATASVSSPRTITAEMPFTEVDNPWVRIWIIHYSSDIIY